MLDDIIACSEVFENLISNSFCPIRLLNLHDVPNGKQKEIERKRKRSYKF